MNTAYWGRVWKLTVTPQATISAAKPDGEEWTISNSGWDTEALKITFAIEMQPVVRYWFADIVIYNFLPALQQVVQAGDVVKLTAGYQSPGASLIFSGKVFQPLWERAGETDYTLTLHCVIGLWEDQNGHVSTTIPANTSRSDAVRLIANAATPAVPIEFLDPALDSAPTKPRAEAFAGPASLFFAQTARDLPNLNYWMSWKGVNIRSLAPQGSVPDLIYAPPYAATAQSGTNDGDTKYILIGTPQQTEGGVSFRVLMDPALQLAKLVNISTAIWKKVALYPGQKLFVDPDGVYVVAGIKHVGDTRGDDWYTEVTAVTRDQSKLIGAQAL